MGWWAGANNRIWSRATIVGCNGCLVCVQEGAGAGGSRGGGAGADGAEGQGRRVRRLPTLLGWLTSTWWNYFGQTLSLYPI